MGGCAPSARGRVEIDPRRPDSLNRHISHRLSHWGWGRAVLTYDGRHSVEMAHYNNGLSSMARSHDIGRTRTTVVNSSVSSVEVGDMTAASIPERVLLMNGRSGFGDSRRAATMSVCGRHDPTADIAAIRRGMLPTRGQARPRVRNLGLGVLREPVSSSYAGTLFARGSSRTATTPPSLCHQREPESETGASFLQSCRALCAHFRGEP